MILEMMKLKLSHEEMTKGIEPKKITEKTYRAMFYSKLIGISCSHPK